MTAAATPLSKLLITRIENSGPISIADYMADCLLHPKYGYYATRDPFGRAGDFITAPEISQMFGELIGLFLAQSWLDQGAPGHFLLAEIGPGRGSLMADILRTTKSVPGFHTAANIHLIEASPTLRQRQKQTLSAYSATWHDTIADLPEGPLFLVANEFFDALPIRQFLRHQAGWRERRVGLRDGQLSFGASDPVQNEALTNRLDDTKPGDLIEICAPAHAIAAEIATRIGHKGGTALYIDYGNWHGVGDTLQAVKNHAPIDPLATPGEADLTAHVDFEALSQAGSEASTRIKHSELAPQGQFLERLGISHRTQILAKNLTGSALENHVSAHRRLTHPQEMGTLFKAFAVYPANAPLPPGFLK